MNQQAIGPLDEGSVIELYSEQDAETKVIVPTLRNLGYDEQDSRRNVVLRFRHPIAAQQGREKRTIFADIVVFVDDVPVIVLDAKNPRRYLTDNDREQVISYARLIGDIAPYAALSNGHTWQVFDTVSKRQIPALPPLDGLISDLQRRQLGDRQRTSLQTQATRTLFAIDSARDLSRIMRRCHDIIRNLQGYDPTKAFDELSKLLFAKMYEEREIADGVRTTNRFTLAKVRDMREHGVEIIQTLWSDTVNSDRYRGVFSDHDVAGGIELPPEAIDQIVSVLESKSLGLTGLDVKGVAFEEFLAATYRGGGLGQYFTPREVVNFMVDLVDPAIGERVIDPACGTGGFLIRVYDVVSEKIRSSDVAERLRKDQLEELARSCLVGTDWETRAARTCKMNMIIHGDGHAGVYQANSLDLSELQAKVARRRQTDPGAPDIEEGTFDIVLTNPPFGASDRANRILKSFELGQGRASQKRDVLILERCVQLLRPGGRLVAVIPEGILSNKRDRHIRDYLRSKCIIKAIVRLPQDAFKKSGGAACTSVIYAVKRKSDDEDMADQGDIFFARAEHIGTNPSGRPIEQNDLIAIREHYQRFEAGDWGGIELKSPGADNFQMLRSAPEKEGGFWLEPEVNRTSLLYDRLSYVVRDPAIRDRFSYTYFHPHYYRVVSALRKLNTDVVTLGELCTSGYPRRGKKPKEESADGIPVLKVRNVTGNGINLETEYAPDTEQIRSECSKASVQLGDLLLTSTGEGTIGRVDLYPYAEIAIADGHVAICRFTESVTREYMAEYLRSEHGQVQILRHVNGSTGQTELLVGHIKNILVPVPSPSAQGRIVERMQRARAKKNDLLGKADALRQQAAAVIGEAQQDMEQMLGGNGGGDDERAGPEDCDQLGA